MFFLGKDDLDGKKVQYALFIDLPYGIAVDQCRSGQLPQLFYSAADEGRLDESAGE